MGVARSSGAYCYAAVLAVPARVPDAGQAPRRAHMSKSWLVRLRAVVAGVIMPAALICGLGVPNGATVAAAADSGLGGAASIAGGFALGDALEATIDERDGAVRFEIPVGG